MTLLDKLKSSNKIGLHAVLTSDEAEQLCILIDKAQKIAKLHVVSLQTDAQRAESKMLHMLLRRAVSVVDGSIDQKASDD